MNSTSIEELLNQLRQYFQKDNFTRENVNEKPPLRLELLSNDQMAQHAHDLATFHKLISKPTPELLLGRLAENEEIITKVTNLLQDTVKNEKSITPAGEWLLDNFYLIEEQISIAKRHLPKGYSKGLPRLAKGKSVGLPRVYDIAIEIISHSDGHVDSTSLHNFIMAYQNLTPLTIGELWAIPIMLRLALLENLSRVAARLAVDRIDEELADHWATRIIEVSEKDPKNLVLVIADMARSNPPMVSAFITELSRRLQWKGSDLTLPLTWIEQNILESGLSISAHVLYENQKQAADQVSMSNSINSLRFLAKTDWQDFVEEMSIVEKILREDIGGVYGQMDFFSRDRYRHAVEKIAKTSTSSELAVARTAIDLAKESAQQTSTDQRLAHVGYYLIDAGVKKTERMASVKLTFVQKIDNFVDRSISTFYFISALLITALVAAALITIAYHVQIPYYLLIFIGALAILNASHLAFAIVNWVATLRVRPKPLPRMNFAKGIPDNCRTLVVVPTLIVDARQIESLLEDLEVRFLANQDPNLIFALLTDFKDAHEQFLPQDAALVDAARFGIEQLNRRHGSLMNDKFFLFHRPRQWNAKEKLWMGYERKRGKLAELNQVLRGVSKHRFSLIIGEEQVYRSVKYVITLDTDTQLPRDAAWKLVGILAHPLNQAQYSEKKKRVVQGYGIIQPRICIGLHGAVRTRYTRMHENDAGIDPYTHVVSDVYQDVFQEGSFIGKGIYEVDIFEKTLHDRFPENRILSHDLLEGAYVRCGYASDVQLYEDYPPHYSIDVSRRHRWIRGDWQIGIWFLPFVPDVNGRLQGNPTSALSRWKIFDNLRRSLTPISLITTLLLSWFALPSQEWFWAFCVTLVIMLPSLIISTWNVVHKPKEIEFRQHIFNSVRNTYYAVVQACFTIVCLPYEAFINTDAIVRTVWRSLFTKRNLLEWNPSGLVRAKSFEDLPGIYRSMIISPLSSIVILIALLKFSPAALFVALPFLMVWMIAPTIVWWLSSPLTPVHKDLTSEQKLYVRELARKTWLFFENLVTPNDSWLPPDNLQQYPISVIAHRTSPTNIGLSLLANLTAYDFGFIAFPQVIDRTNKTFASMQRMERYKGHFYNWYDTETLLPLNPRYVSTVDSGNLAGHLITLRQGLLSLPDSQMFEHRLLGGLHDVLRVVEKMLSISDKSSWEIFKNEYEEIFKNNPSSLRQLVAQLKKLDHGYASIIKNLQINQNTEAYQGLTTFENQLKVICDSITLFQPWAMAEVPSKFSSLEQDADQLSLQELTELDAALKSKIDACKFSDNSPLENDWLKNFEKQVATSSQRAKEQVVMIKKLAEQCSEFATMEYDFLYDASLRLLAIGYNVDQHHRDTSYYDLLASEARLGLFVAIAQGKLPQESWFALGRRLTKAGQGSVLLSWSGSMFEYLMPILVMPSYENTLLDETNKSVVEKQVEYGKQQNIPWGISESCYNIVDTHLTYQYRAFGVPGLGFKRGLSEDRVIAPYASVMAMMINPQVAYENLQRLVRSGFEGIYGFYEAVDYTPARLPRNQTRVLIQTFMSHHQGMSLLSLAYVLLDKPMQKRFEADQQMQTALLLLQERIPQTTGLYSAATDAQKLTSVAPTTEIRILNTAHTPLVPEIQLLSNGHYHVMITSSGAGYSRWRDLAVTRWREDGTCDNWGSFCYIRDLDSGEYWSTTHHPTQKEADEYAAIFSQGRVEFRRLDNDIEAHTEIVVSPEDNMEIRRIHIKNRSRKKRTIELTTYAEVVLALPAADEAHTAFSNLFVQTEIVSNRNAIRSTRRARSHDEQPPWMFHLMKCTGAKVNEISYETDRTKFIGRGNSLVSPQAMKSKDALSGSDGSVLDPIVSIQYRVTLQPYQTVIFDVVTGMAENREGSQLLIDKYQDQHLRDRSFELSWTYSQVVLRQINATESEAQLFGRLASSVIYTNPTLRADQNILLRNERGQSALWSYSISGDLPIVLLQISDSSNVLLVKQLIQAHAYWQLKGLEVDLIIINEDYGSYRQVLQDQIHGLIAAGTTVNTSGKKGNIYIRSADQMPNEDKILIQTVARIIISDKQGTLLDQISKRINGKPAMPILMPALIEVSAEDHIYERPKLLLFNGHGGFSTDGCEYVITTTSKKQTPLPWINVLANKNFGTVVTESGPSYTWYKNAHEFRLTPWNNDSITGNSGEAFYIRDEETGQYWSPMPWPVMGKGAYVTRHGFGYTVYEHTENKIQSEVWVFVDQDASLKFSLIKIRNLSGKMRRLTVTGYAEWALGDMRSKTQMHITTEMDLISKTIIAKNPYSGEFPHCVSFFSVDYSPNTFTTDRLEFIGRNGSLHQPDAMRRTKLSGRFGAGYDPCAAIQISLPLENDDEKEIVFRMGAASNRGEALEIVRKFQGVKAAKDSLQQVRSFWHHTLHSVQIETPDASLNILTNGWLLYQVMSSRLWGRTGFYQSGGAFGFRDQLQDVMAIMHAKPELAREHILLSASRQFIQGDVQHWWHPPLGRGVRTQCSDDFLWLPFVVSRYVETTGDIDILQENIAFLEGRPLNVDEESYYDLPIRSEKKSTLYEHCKLAVNHGLRFGSHGLPLMGSGDWNDGMNMVGIQGRGESVWLAFFLYDVLNRFVKIARLQNDHEFVQHSQEHALQLRQNINTQAWDGQWYVRAFYDDGTPLGSSQNKECRIDSISQSWSILSGVGTAGFSEKAMRSVDQYLINKEASLIKLLEPPFNDSDKDPGYIKGYVPGVRENGGQYTHAAIWMVMAFAKMGNRQRTWELLNMINPLTHSLSQDKISIYKTEPYVMAADVYGVEPHTGRGGWTWYTGSAGWMYQLILESFCGIRRSGNTLHVAPCLPREWPSITIQYRFKETNYRITIEQNENIDNYDETTFELVDDKTDHTIVVKTGKFSEELNTQENLSNTQKT